MPMRMCLYAAHLHFDYPLISPVVNYMCVVLCTHTYIGMSSLAIRSGSCLSWKAACCTLLFCAGFAICAALVQMLDASMETTIWMAGLLWI